LARKLVLSANMRHRPEVETQRAEAEGQGAEVGGQKSEASEVSRLEAWKREEMYWEDWPRLLPQAVQYAEGQIGRRYWRGERGGVLPEGHDANSVAAEVIAGMLTGKCRIAPGWTRERFEREMERRIKNEVRRLASLTEAAEIRSEWDILPPTEDDEAQSVFDGMPGSIPDPREEAEQNEYEAWRERVRVELNFYLGRDKDARNVLNCLCDGVMKRREIARQLGISVKAVTAARKRLERKAKEYWMSKLLGAGLRTQAPTSRFQAPETK
jgi:hypothetical protein